MKNIGIVIFLTIAVSCTMKRNEVSEAEKRVAPLALVIHGGAGTITRLTMSAEREQQYHAALRVALDSGYAVLERGGNSTDAVLRAVQLLEDSPLFNAGKGAVFTNDGVNELDASIMVGKNLMAGAVAGIKTVRSPILLAHAVMTKSPHVFLSGAGAEQFAQEQGLEIVPADYFFDSLRFKQHQRSLQKDHEQDNKFGTVGCVALDQDGNIAAGTSTGGMMNKKYGRIGDSPVIGAGTYANNATCGISSTGWGEYFIRLNVAYDVSALMEYRGLTLKDAANRVIMEKLPALGGDGGIIGLTRHGEIVMTFNTEGMYRGFKRKGEPAKTFIYKDEN